MKIRCRVVQGIVATKAMRQRHGPYSSGGVAGDRSRVAVKSGRLCSQVPVPSELLDAGTVGDLASYLANGEDGGVGGCPLPQLNIEGFTLLASEPLKELLRDQDEVLVCYPTGQKMLEDVPLTAAPMDESYASGLARLSKQQSMRIAELSAELEARGLRLAALERHVVELQQQLACVSAASQPMPVSVLAEYKCEQGIEVLSPQNARSGPSAITALQSMPPGKRSVTCLDDQDSVQWKPLSAVGALHAGDIIRYRLALVDAWRQRMIKSGRRTARVAKLQRDGLAEPVVVLQHAGGALDCVEVSQLMDLQVQHV